MENAAKNGINLRETTALLVSHSHINHSNDINAVIDAMTYSGLDKKGVLVANKETINSNENHQSPLNPHFRDFLERFIVLEAGQRVGINEIEILALTTRHSEKAIGFKFFTPYFTLSYSSDTKYSPELIEQYKNSNILILNVPHLKKEDSKNNLCVEDAIKIIKEVAPRLAIVQHFGIEMVKADLLYQIREMQKATGIQTILAKDGMVINPLSYSVDQGQRTLQSLQKLKEKDPNHPIVKEPQATEQPAVEEQEIEQQQIEQPAQEEDKEITEEIPQETIEEQKPLDQKDEGPKQEATGAIEEPKPIIEEQKQEENILESKEALKDILREGS